MCPYEIQRVPMGEQIIDTIHFKNPPWDKPLEQDESILKTVCDRKVITVLLKRKQF